MQLLYLTLRHHNLYSPVTGEPISKENEGLFDTNPNFKGLWHHENMLDPIFNDSDLEEAWNDFLEDYDAKHQDEPDEDAIEQFLLSFPEPNWVIYKNNYQQVEGGVITSVVWTVVGFESLTPR